MQPLDRSGECQSTALLLARSNTSLPSRAVRCSERPSTPFSAAAARQYSMSPWTHTQTSQPHPGPDPGGSFPRDPNSPFALIAHSKCGGTRRQDPCPLHFRFSDLGYSPSPCFSGRTRAALTRPRLPCSRGLLSRPVAKLTAARGRRGLAMGGPWGGRGRARGARGSSLNQLQT